MNDSEKFVIEEFGYEWKKFDQSHASYKELKYVFTQYFKIFPWDKLPEKAVGFDLGCGSGRWAFFVADRVKKLYCVDASKDALKVASKNLRNKNNCEFIKANAKNLPFENCSMDFGYALGVLHHINDPLSAMKQCVLKLKPGAPFLVYMYYAFDNKPFWFRLLWKSSDLFRYVISHMPQAIKYGITQIIAAIVYYPLAKSALLFEKTGLGIKNFPLSEYRHRSFYNMRNDALDRFGTRIEKRFTAKEIKEMMEIAGLEKVKFSTSVPYYWCAVGYKKAS